MSLACTTVITPHKICATCLWARPSHWAVILFSSRLFLNFWYFSWRIFLSHCTKFTKLYFNTYVLICTWYGLFARRYSTWFHPGSVGLTKGRLFGFLWAPYALAPGWLRPPRAYAIWGKYRGGHRLQDFRQLPLFFFWLLTASIGLYIMRNLLP